MQIKASGGILRSNDIRVPGDKSISHRSIILGAIAEGTTVVTGCLLGADVVSTIGCFRLLGAQIEVDGETVSIRGVGRDGFLEPKKPLDAGNAGTCMRLVSGVLAGQPFVSTFVGDHSLSKRPMGRIIDPLERMGAQIEAAEKGTAPLRITGRSPLSPIVYQLPVASAQIKSAVLLAGLYASGPTSVIELEPVRDHTERMLAAFGARIERIGSQVTIYPSSLKAQSISVPGDISSAAFFVVGCLLAQNCQLAIRDVGLNPLRTGVLDILGLMGANILVTNLRQIGGEDVGDLVIKSSNLTGIDIPRELVSRAIDEFPIILVAAAFAKGRTTLVGAEELKVKESDRIAAMVDGLQAIGIDANATHDGAIITGSSSAKGGCKIVTDYDHRIAMAFTIASLKCDEPLLIEEADSITTSFPGFVNIGRSLGLKIEEQF